MQKPYVILGIFQAIIAKAASSQKRGPFKYQKVASSTVLAYAPPPISSPITAPLNNLPCTSNAKSKQFKENQRRTEVLQFKHLQLTLS